jgi:hypothetical protein
MKAGYRLAVYALVTAIVEGPCVVVLYSFGYPNNVSGPGSLVELVALNLFVYLLWGNAIGGPEAAAAPGSWIYNPIVQLAGGVVGMFVIVAVVGETMNWLGEKMMEITGTEKELLRFKKQLDSAVHNFVGATYSSKQVQRAAETRINELYSKHPELVLECLSETLERIKEMGTNKTAARVEMLIKELQHRAKNEQSS